MPSVLIGWPTATTTVLRLSRPERMNALTHEMLAELRAGLRDAAASDEARAVILTQSGRAGRPDPSRSSGRRRAGGSPSGQSGQRRPNR
jgi:1,4-dihydroxy-2-naphthoyl-CoA synthase